MGCPVALLHGVPMGLWAPSMGLVGEDGGRVQTGHQGPQGWGYYLAESAHCVSLVLLSWLCYPEPCPCPGYVLSVHSVIVSMCFCKCLCAK